MGFLRRVRVPDELPDLAIEDGSVVPQNRQQNSTPPLQAKTLPPTQTTTPQQMPQTTTIHSQKQVEGEDFLEFQEKTVQKTQLEQTTPEALLEMAKEDKEKDGYFSKVLEDINDEMGDLGKLGDWYEGKLAQQDVVSDMKSYWEGNKADMIIRSFGSEYKKKIAAKVEKLRELENDWRDIYFNLVKKEEEMKKEEKLLKETISEFVDLCKRKKQMNGETKEEQTFEERNTQT